MFKRTKFLDFINILYQLKWAEKLRSNLKAADSTRDIAHPSLSYIILKLSGILDQ